MNPLDLDATQLVVWALIAHVIADWLLQTDWMAKHKAERGGWPARKRRAPGPQDSPTEVLSLRMDTRIAEGAPAPPPPWWKRHPAAYAHAGIHAVALAPLFGWVTLPLAVVHLLIDTRTPVAWWARLIRQTQPHMRLAVSPDAACPNARPYKLSFDDPTIKVRWENEEGREVNQQGHVVSEATVVQRKVDALMGDMREWTVPVIDVATVVRMAVDQAFHVAVLAAAALLVTL
jgi:hypothetical protein